MLGQGYTAKKAEDAGLKKRMRIFVETIVKSVSPVFLAAYVSLVKVDMGDQPLLRDSLSPLAGLTLAFGILSLLPLTFPNWFPHRLYPYRFSMSFIHLCGVLLMVLAYLALVLFSETYAWPLCAFLVPTAISASYYGILTVRKKHASGARVVYDKCLDELENSVDFLAAIAFLLFLGFGGLMIQGQYKTIQQRENCLTKENKEMLPLLYIVILLSFVVCIFAVHLMLVGMVPPVFDGEGEDTCDIIHVYNYSCGCALALLVLFLTHGKLRCWYASALASVISALPFVAWVILHYNRSGIGRGDEEVKPASLDLTKVSFTGFVVVSMYTISENSPVSIREYSCWFIFFAGIAVNTCLGWRLLTHEKKPSTARFTAANFASLCAHIYITAAAILFAFLTHDAFRKITSPTAPSPAACP